MSTSHDATAAVERGADEHPLLPYSTYVKVWMALVTLTLITVAAAYANLHHMAIIVAVMIAAGKSTLVVLWFMHMKYEARLFKWFLVAGLTTYAIFLALTFADYGYRS
jgi:cytochrome c oxidase subunit 4